MVKKHFIILFLFLSTSLVFYYNAIANDNVDEDKIKTSIQNTAKDLTKKALLSIGSSVLTKEEIKELIGDESDSCVCQ